MVEPGQDLLLAALSESGISPNDLFDIDGGDAGLATPAPTPSVHQVRVLQSLTKVDFPPLILISTYKSR